MMNTSNIMSTKFTEQLSDRPTKKEVSFFQKKKKKKKIAAITTERIPPFHTRSITTEMIVYTTHYTRRLIFCLQRVCI